MASQRFREIPILHQRTVNGVTESCTGKLTLRPGRSDRSVDLYEGDNFYVGTLGLYHGDSAHQLADALAEAINQSENVRHPLRRVFRWPATLWGLPVIDRDEEVADRQAWLDDVRRRLGLVTIEHGEPEPPQVPLMLPRSAARTIALLELAAEFDQLAACAGKYANRFQAGRAWHMAADKARAAAARSEQARRVAGEIADAFGLPDTLTRAWEEHPEVRAHRRMTGFAVTPVPPQEPPPANEGDKMWAALDELAVHAIPVTGIVMREGFRPGLVTACGHSVIRVATSALEWGVLTAPEPAGDVGQLVIGKLRAGLSGGGADELIARAIIAEQPMWQVPSWWQFRGEIEGLLDRLARKSIQVRAIAVRENLWGALTMHAGYPVVAIADSSVRWGVIT
jgi:hypothetical protein